MVKLTFVLLLITLYLSYPQLIKATSSEEQAIYSRSRSLPEGIVEDATNSGGLFSGFFEFLKSLTKDKFNLIFQKPDKVKDPIKVSTTARVLHQAELPPELQPSMAPTPNPGNILKQVADSLGGKSGIYCITVPIFEKDSERTPQNCAKAYQDSNFPPEVKPITGQ